MPTRSGSAPIGVPTTFDGEYGADFAAQRLRDGPAAADDLRAEPRRAARSSGGDRRHPSPGSNFAQVKGVAFGSTPAAGFSVGSEGQITATAPASKTIAAVPITVTTAAGTASAAQTFAYEGCTVPKLRGKKLKATKKKLKKADCKTGKVKKRKGATAATGEVVKQSAKPGTILAPGAKVKVTLGP